MRMNVRFAESGKTFTANFKKEKRTFETDFGQIHNVTEYVGGEPYDGDYIVTPRVAEQVMPTKEKVMLEDVTIRGIPYYETSNLSGGNTVYIAKEV